MRRWRAERALVAAAALVLGATSLGADVAGQPAPADVVVDDWTAQPIGTHGVPGGWKAYETPGGRPTYDFTIVDDGAGRALRLRSHDEHSTIAKQITVDLNAFPVLVWSWKIVRLPDGADVRERRTTDLTGHLFVVWPRFPALLRSRLIGYIWDPVVPAGSTVKSRKTGTTTFVVLHSGPADLGRWITERRDVAADYLRIYGEKPDNPAILALSIDTNDTHAAAEALIGRIVFRGR